MEGEGSGAEMKGCDCWGGCCWYIVGEESVVAAEGAVMEDMEEMLLELLKSEEEGEVGTDWVVVVVVVA